MVLTERQKGQSESADNCTSS